jgi:tetratricopeptide (TPR) repeat protein
VQLDPDDAEILYNFGDSLHDCGRPKEAEKAFDRLVHLRPDYADAWNTLGIIKEDLGDLDGATECYQKAVDLDPHLERAQKNLRRANAKFWQSLAEGLYDDND